MAARRRREPMGWTPVRRSWRSSRGVETVLGSRVGGRGDGVDVVSRASSFRWVVVVKLWVEGRGLGPRLAGFRRQRIAGRMVEVGTAMMNVTKIYIRCRLQCSLRQYR